MLLSLLFLIILATMAYQSNKVVLTGLVFGALKAIASTFYYFGEPNMPYDTGALLAGTQFAANSLLGIAIAYLVVKRSQDWKYSFVTASLAVLTFMTSLFEPLIVTA